MTRIVDSHVHVWNPALAEYTWMSTAPGLDRPFDLADVAREHAELGICDVVLVQAADNLADTANMFRTAQMHSNVAGVVVWVPLDDPSAAAQLLDSWRDQHVVGARHLVHRDRDPDLLRSPRVQDTIRMLGDRGLTFDVCAESIHLLELTPELAAAAPDTTLVIDHLAKPPIRDRGWEPWASLLAEAAACPNVVAKVSGLNTAVSSGWTAQDFRPYVRHAFEVFGARRLMYGGDWPFALLAADSYTSIWNGLAPLFAELTDTDRDEVLEGTARRTYGLRADPSRAG